MYQKLVPETGTRNFHENLMQVHRMLRFLGKQPTYRLLRPTTCVIVI